MQIKQEISYLCNMKTLHTLHRLLGALVIVLLLVACGDRSKEHDTKTIFVSIAPLKGLVEGIVGDDFPVEVLVPAGASPETFEPTPRQLIAVNHSQWLFAVGLIDFEQALLSKIGQEAHIVTLHEGVELIAGHCSHHHHTTDRHHHPHGIDPHIWTSPRALQTMAANLYNQIHTAYPDSLRYTENYERLQANLHRLDLDVASKLAISEQLDFIVYHPALAYYARDYGLQQHAIEQEGKEPSARHLARLIALAREKGIDRILYQRRFPRSSVEAIAKDMGAEMVEFDPLDEDICSVIRHITHQITRQ